MVTVTVMAPAEPEGVVQVIDDEELTATPVALFKPNFTVAPAINPEPVMVTAVPPASAPDAGVAAVTVGAA